MEIEKDELESYLNEQMENVFGYVVLTKDGLTITKFGDNYHMNRSPVSAQKVLQAINEIQTINDSTDKEQ